MARIGRPGSRGWTSTEPSDWNTSRSNGRRNRHAGPGGGRGSSRSSPVSNFAEGSAITAYRFGYSFPSALITTGASGVRRRERNSSDARVSARREYASCRPPASWAASASISEGEASVTRALCLDCHLVQRDKATGHRVEGRRASNAFGGLAGDPPPFVGAVEELGDGAGEEI